VQQASSVIQAIPLAHRTLIFA